MEDIEDLLVGGGGGAPPGFRLPLNAVGVKPRKNNKNKPNPANTKLSQIHDFNSPKIPGTQVLLLLSRCGIQHLWMYFMVLIFIFQFFVADNIYKDFWVLA